MIVRRIDRATLDAALALINREVYGGNIEYKSGPDPEGTGFRFTIQAIDTRGLGSRFSSVTLPDWQSGGTKTTTRRVKAACWHAHGHLFDAILALSPESWLRALGRRIDTEGGNWRDYNSGSMMYPRYASELCECDERGMPLDTIDWAQTTTK